MQDTLQSWEIGLVRAPQGYSPPQELELEEKKSKISGGGGVICAPSPKHGIVPLTFFYDQTGMITSKKGIIKQLLKLI